MENTMRDPFRLRVSYAKARAEEAEAFLDERIQGKLCCVEEGNELLNLSARVYAYDSGGAAQTDMHRVSQLPGLISLSMIPRSKCNKAGCPINSNE
jgi:hypothetical protein